MIAGKFNTATVDLKAGLLKVTLTDAAGTPIATKPSWSVLGPQNAEGKRPQLAYSYDKVPTFVLPAGPCVIRAKFGDKTAEAPANVTPGRLTEFTLKVAKGVSPRQITKLPDSRSGIPAVRSDWVVIFFGWAWNRLGFRC